VEYKNDCWIDTPVGKWHLHLTRVDNCRLRPVESSLCQVCMQGPLHRCKYCFILYLLKVSYPRASTQIISKWQICLCWNDTRAPFCYVCNFQCIYYICTCDLAIINVSHKEFIAHNDTLCDNQSSFSFLQKASSQVIGFFVYLTHHLCMYICTVKNRLGYSINCIQLQLTLYMCFLLT